MSKITEKKVEVKLASYYRSQDCIVLRQAAFARKRIDIVKKERDDENVVAIEIKLKDWQCGLRQARVNALACDQSYLAVWHQHATPALNNRKIFENAGVGLIVINEEFKPRVEIEPGGNSSSKVIRAYFCSNNLKLA
ncbi:MAG: hypothetical protein ACD_81C00100G0009 [uncultured bacterium]|uniref:Uncharacterized protein n=1 Tax=Candidatus Wolfebacteria bacterium GW2011_GWE2_44_13 TaxID=1619017 RepID=A0A0G1JG30_9BACT|nr:MAG: hypothetical protein ACD_81C00100G0009 [uncultured bacterium]KKT42987.1 MAG: hypothetical protein UW32_C0003G0090 [Candidatus Wolfebacteria bacterium GW2011_GWE2_44_13]